MSVMFMTAAAEDKYILLRGMSPNLARHVGPQTEAFARTDGYQHCIKSPLIGCGADQS